jgi:hypothetical protein
VTTAAAPRLDAGRAGAGSSSGDCCALLRTLTATVVLSAQYFLSPLDHPGTSPLGASLTWGKTPRPTSARMH